MKILVAENNDELAYIVRTLLEEDERIEVVGTVCSAEDALAEVDRLKPSLVVLDHFLDSVETGIELAAKMKVSSPETSVLIFSDYDLSVEASREPAVDAYLPKTKLAQLRSIVLQYLPRAG